MSLMQISSQTALEMGAKSDRNRKRKKDAASDIVMEDNEPYSCYIRTSSEVGLIQNQGEPHGVASLCSQLSPSNKRFKVIGRSMNGKKVPVFSNTTKDNQQSKNVHDKKKDKATHPIRSKYFLTKEKLLDDEKKDKVTEPIRSKYFLTKEKLLGDEKNDKVTEPLRSKIFLTKEKPLVDEKKDKVTSKNFKPKEKPLDDKKKDKVTERKVTFTAAEKRCDAYKRVSPDNKWNPPRTRLNLLKEEYAYDPWRVLVICILLNVTTGKQVREVLPKFFSLCPDAQTTMGLKQEDIMEVIQTQGLQEKRAQTIKRFSKAYFSDDWTHVTELHGIGKYAADAYAIFITGKWLEVKPDDHVLDRYWAFLFARGFSEQWGVYRQ